MTLTSERDREILRSFVRRIDPSDAAAHNNLGVLYHNRGLHEEAVTAFARAVELDPKMRTARRNLEIAYRGAGYLERRVRELRERLQRQPSDRDARWELARSYAAVGDVRAAVAEFTELLEHYPNDIGAIVQLGLAEKVSGDLERAQRWFERALALDPQSPVVSFLYGEVLYNRGLSNQALSALESAIERSSDNPDAYHLLSFVLGELGRHEEAKAARARAVSLNPALARAQANLSLEPFGHEELGYQAEVGSPVVCAAAGGGQLAHLGLAVAYRHKAYYDQALREYRLAQEAGEDPALVFGGMAEVHLLKHEPEAAFELYERALALQPESPKLWCERGLALHQLGRHLEAGASYRKALALDATYAVAHNNLGVALFHAGQAKEAIGAFRAALAARPNFIKAWLNLALVLVKSRRSRTALQGYRQVLRIVGEQPVAWNGVGVVLTELRQFEEARNAFGRAIQARPTYAEAHYNLSFTLSNLGDFEGALRATKRALELDPLYVAQKFELAIDVESEDSELSVAPELDGARRVEQGIDTFTFDAGGLDSVFAELGGQPAEPEAANGAAGGAFATAEDYLSKGLFDLAAAEINRVLSRGGDRVEGLTLWGDVFAKQGLHGEALERYQDALRVHGESARALRGQVRSLVLLGRAAEAHSMAGRLLALDGSDADTLMLLATARCDAGDPGGARELLARARRLAPSRADLLCQLGDVARVLGERQSAIAAYRDALALDPRYAVVHVALARLLVQEGLIEEAERALLAAIDTVPTYAEATLTLAAVRRDAGRPRDALAPLIELLQRDPYNLDALVGLGETLVALNRSEDAAIAFDRVRRFDPDHAAALFFEGLLLAEQHRYRGALQRWGRVAEVDPDGPFSERAREAARTAVDMLKIFRRSGEE